MAFGLVAVSALELFGLGSSFRLCGGEAPATVGPPRLPAGGPGGAWASRAWCQKVRAPADWLDAVVSAKCDKPQGVPVCILRPQVKRLANGFPTAWEVDPAWRKPTRLRPTPAPSAP